MSRPIGLQNQFNAGMKRDAPRNRMAPNSAWNLEDVILDYGAPVRERSGWAHASNVIDPAFIGDYVRGGIFSIFSPTAGALPTNMFIDNEGNFYTLDQAGDATGFGSARVIAQNPVFHGGTAASAASAIYTGLVIIPDGTGAAVPKKFDGTTLSDLGGTPPKARYATVYGDYTCLGNGMVGTTTYPNRLWFSPPGDPDAGFSGSQTAWDTTDSWIDFSLPIEGLAATKNALLVFHTDRVSRIRGNSPPPDEDMVVDDPFQLVGLLDPFSITINQDMVYWCAPEGVFRTDGVSLDNITLKGGMLRYWLDMQVSATTAWTFATGIIRDNLVITVMNGDTFVDAFIVNLSNYAWARLKNLDAIAFWDGLYGNADDEFFARRGAARIGRLETMYAVGQSAYKNDGDGDAVVSVLETSFYELGAPGLKVIKNAWVGYSLTDFGSDNPAITASYISTPEDETYTELGVLTEQEAYARQRLTLGGRHYGIALKFARGGAGDFLGYDLACDIHAQEQSKL
jgi:hypothetical protein